MIIGKAKEFVKTVLYCIYNNYYEKKVRSRIKNDNFSILCSNCIGGIIYHRLNKPFLSPTINLWMYQPDFLKFILNLREYISKELEFVDSECDYPVAMLGDVKIFFNHYKTVESAKEDWERRKKRINYENLFVIMYDRDNISKDDIRKLEYLQCKNKVVLSDKECTDIEYVLSIKPSNRAMSEQFLDEDFLGRRTFEKNFDYVRWLNCE